MTRLLVERDSYIDSLARFIETAPTSYHAAEVCAEVFRAAGFVEYHETESWDVIGAGSSGFVRRDGAIVAWCFGEAARADSPIRMLGCHTDSPGLVLKPDSENIAHGWRQLGVEIYGSPVLSTWFDRDLAIAGRVVTCDGTEHLVHTRPVARVPTLAIHLDRGSGNTQVIDQQQHMQPVIATSAWETRDAASQPGVLPELIAEAAGIRTQEIISAELRLVDTQLPARLGTNAELFASARLDNLSSVFAGSIALTQCEVDAESIALFAAFDHEEVGSQSRSGASGSMLTEVLARLRDSLGATVEQTQRALAASWCLSADAGHSVHPNYADKHDAQVRPVSGSGPMLKMNANQRYATDAHGAALWQRICRVAGVRTQVFVSRNTVPCGSTIGPLTATRIGMRTLDAGVPLLSMHSARELAHVDDLHGLARVIAMFFAQQ